jgi:predicted secreted protein
MTDTNIGAGKIILALEGNTPDTFVGIGELYDPIPEIEVSRDGVDDTNTGSVWERTKAGMRKAAPVAFKIKTDAAGYADVIAAFNDGAEKRWKFTIPNDSVTKGATEEIIFKAWVGSHKKAPSLKDETFIFINLNINEVED